MNASRPSWPSAGEHVWVTSPDNSRHLFKIVEAKSPAHSFPIRLRFDGYHDAKLDILCKEESLAWNSVYEYWQYKEVVATYYSERTPMPDVDDKIRTRRLPGQSGTIVGVKWDLVLLENSATFRRWKRTLTLNFGLAELVHVEATLRWHERDQTWEIDHLD